MRPLQFQRASTYWGTLSKYQACYIKQGLDSKMNKMLSIVQTLDSTRFVIKTVRERCCKELKRKAMM